MSQTAQELIKKLNEPQCRVEFKDVISHIESHYNYLPSRFTNGEVVNEAGTNEGSCKIFAFALLHQLSEQATLNCFGNYYHQDVMLNPENTDHANIRNFIKSGWAGINFDSSVLTPK